MLDRKKKIARALKSSNKTDISQQIIAQMQALLGNGFAISLYRERPWASITFSGIRHQIIVRPVGDYDENWSKALSQLPEHEFILRGSFVADVNMEKKPCALKEKGQHALVEVLTIFDPVSQN